MIRNVVFDVGNVLVKLHYQPFIGYLAGAGVDLSDLPGWLKAIDLEGHERGDLDGDVLLQRIAATASRPLDPAELRTRWLSMFERWDEMFELASGLMSGYRVYLLSNIGPALGAPRFAVRCRLARARRLRFVPGTRGQAACGHLPQGRADVRSRPRGDGVPR
jgi:FMN phosphatase YigB (HAD superfamily)